MGNLSRAEKDKREKVVKSYWILLTYFWWFVVWTATNILSVFRVSDSWIEARAGITYILRPLIWSVIWWKFFEKRTYDEVKIKSFWWNALLSIVILIFSWFCRIYTIKYEQEKALCKTTESTIENYLTCIWNAQDNILNLWKIFHD